MRATCWLVVFFLVCGEGGTLCAAAAETPVPPPATEQRTTVSLDGTWKFFPAFTEIRSNHAFLQDGLAEKKTYPDSDPDKHYGWIEPDFDDAPWWDIAVPASWNTQFEDLWSYEGEGWYRRRVEVPAEWEGKRVLVQFDSANYRTVLYVNGSRAGIHEGGYTQFAFRVDPYLKFGAANTLAVAVDNESRLDRVPMERHDWWDHGGLYRPVRMVVTDPSHLDHVVVTTESIGPPARVRFTVDVAGPASPAAGDRYLVARLFDGAGQPVAAVASGRFPVGDAKHEAALALAVGSPRPWSPDDPYLYEAAVELRDGSTDRCLDTWRVKVGIRTVAVDGARLLVNGKPFLVKGVCRYENYPDTGMTSTEAGLSRDLSLIKGLGANAVRCHYTYGPETYDALDEKGLFAVCEVPLYQWGRPGHSVKNLEAARQQLEEMVRTLGNHPSVMMWSVSNENRIHPREPGEEHARLSRMVVDGNLELVALAHQLDPTRPVIEPSNCWPDDEVLGKTDLNSVNVYIGVPTPDADGVRAMPAAIHERFNRLRELHPNKPILATEFGSWALRGLKTEYFPGERFQAEQLKTEWETFLREPAFAGGFIWCFADSDVHRKFTSIYEMRCAYGLYDLQRRPKASAEVMRGLWNKAKSTK